MANEKGILLALLTAIISGVSVFVNGFVVKGMDPFVFTTMKNVSVTVFLFSAIFLMREYNEILRLNRGQLAKLITIGFVGGGIPFLLFFWGLSLSSGAVGSFVYRLLFIFAIALAFVALKERINRNFVIGGLLAVFGNVLLLKGEIAFGFGELLILLATILWAIEFNISKTALRDINPKMVAFGRMFFGSLVMLAFLAVSGKFSLVAGLGAVQWEWIAITTAFLFGYLLAWYPALKELPVSVATPVLALGGPVSAVLSLVFAGKAIAPIEAVGMLVIVIGIVVMANLYEFFKTVLNIKVARA